MFFDDFKMGESFDIPPVFIDKADMIEFAKKYDNIPMLNVADRFQQ